jgi:hypothetical protein
MLKTFSRKSCHLKDNVEIYGRAEEATDDKATWRMRFACWLIKDINTHSELVILIPFFRGNDG